MKDKKISPAGFRAIIEGAKRRLREIEAKRRELGLRRPEEPGLTQEARRWSFRGA